MPLINVRLIEGVFSDSQKHRLASGSLTPWSPSRAKTCVP